MEKLLSEIFACATICDGILQPERATASHAKPIRVQRIESGSGRSPAKDPMGRTWKPADRARVSVPAASSNVLVLAGDRGVTPNLKGLLERNGVLVLEASDLTRALPVLDSVEVDAVILDARPERMGLEPAVRFALASVRNRLPANVAIFLIVDGVHAQERELAEQYGVHLFPARRVGYRYLVHTLRVLSLQRRGA